MQAVYLIHFEQKYKHAGHYLGYSKDLTARIKRHRTNSGARLLQVVNAAEIGWKVVRVWEDATNADEYRLKDHHNSSRLCPVCNPTGWNKRGKLPGMEETA